MMKTKLKRKRRRRRLLFILTGMLALTFGGVMLLRSCTSGKQETISSPVQSSATVSPPTTMLKLSNEEVPAPNWVTQKSLDTPIRNQSKWGELISYSPRQPPQFVKDPQLQSIIEDIRKLVTSKSLSTENLSIALIDANTNKFGGHKHQESHFPASVAKMFWMVVLYGQINNGMWQNPDAFEPFISKMMKESDNDSSSYIIDSITDTQSSQADLTSEKFKLWVLKRESYINSFFEKAGYPNMNLTQKTYPIPYLKLQEPKGNELQIRLNPTEPAKPIRNRISAMDAARLMYEICYRKEAVSTEFSQRMCDLLKKDLNPNSWKSIKKEDFNPIEGFLGQSLPYKNTEFFSKAGWTPNSGRQEVSMIRMRDPKKEYILAVFAEDPKFGKDNNIFPKISELIYKKLHKNK
jgi:Beta-lactamase enzyme family